MRGKARQIGSFHQCHVADSLPLSQGSGDKEMSKLLPSQKKKMRQKQRKAKARAKKGAEEKNEELSVSGVSKSRKRHVKPVDPDPHGEKLLQEITSTGDKKGEIYLADVSTKLKNKNITTDIQVDTNSNVELQYQHEYAGISTSIGLTSSPIVKFSGVIGNNLVAVGTNLSFDTASGNFTKYNAGLNITHADLIASLNLHS